MRLERKNGTRKGEKMKKGIDISYWQGKVDFSKVSKSVEFVILREGYRMTIDKRFLEYVQGCKGNSIPIHGVYHFCYATSTVGAEEEAASCIANMRKAGLGKDVIVFFDFEYDTVKKAAEQGITLGKSECIAFTKAFCSYVESQGYKAGVYTNLDYYQNMYDKETLDKYILWLADYTGNPDVKCTYQQYTSSGKVPGINGNVDMNYFFGEKQEEEQMRKTAQDVLNVMRSWLGYNEVNGKFRQIIDLYNSVKPLPRGYAVQYHDEWCDTTVSAAGIKAECSDLIGRECGCEQHVKIFQSMGIWIEDGTIVPKPGDIILYNWGQSYQPNNGYSDHIGFVESVSGGQITCIEGNKGEAVARRVISVGNGNIRGYARPRYSGAGTTPSNPVTPPASGDGSLSKNVAWYGVVNTGMAAAAAEAAEDELDEHSPSKRFYGIGDFAGIGFINALIDNVSKAGKAGREIAKSSIDGLNDVISRIADYVDADMDVQPTIRPVLDLSAVEAGTGRLNTLFSRNQALSVSTGMNERVSEMEVQNGESSSAGNTYQFTQNNYSPKALSRIDIYRQTKNQFSAMKGLVSNT